MVLAAAQSSSLRGRVEDNVEHHVRFVRAAAAAGARLVVFPELSLTGYELDLASELQMTPDDPRLAPLRTVVAELGIHAVVGAPAARSGGLPHLAVFLLSPGEVEAYAKIHVHETEAHAFAPGREPCVVEIERVPTALAICADTRYPTHPASAAQQGARLYVASVLKTSAEYRDHARCQGQSAASHRMAVLTANYAGSSGGVSSAGRSALWDETGRRVAEARGDREALVIARRCEGRWAGEVIESPTL